MADLIAKIGADSSEFRNDVASLPSAVKKNFDGMKTASTGGINDNIDVIKGNMRNLKDLLVGGGIITAVVGFFKAGQEEAEKMAKTGNVIAENFLSIKEAAGNSIDLLGKASVVTFGSLVTVGKTFKEGLENIGALLTGNLTTLQTTRDSVVSTGKAAREHEAALIESKKHAEEFKKLNAEISAATEKRAELELKSLATTDQLAILKGKLLAAEQAEAAAAEDGLARRTAIAEQLRIGNDIMATGKVIQGEIDKAQATRRTEVEALHKTQLAALEPLEREKILRQEIRDATALLASGLLNATGADAQRVVLATRQKELAETLNAEHAKEVDFKKKAALGVEDQIKLEKLLAKGATGRTGAEQAALDVLTLQGKAKANQVEIETLLERKVSQGLTPAEQARLAQLIKQESKLDDQITVKKLLIDQAATQLTAEQQITAELAHRAAQEAAALKNAITLTQQRVQVEQVSHGNTYASQSTDSLEGTRARLSSQRDEAVRGNSQWKMYAGYDNPAIAQLENDIRKIDGEINQRRDIQRYAQTYGQSAAVRQYGDELTANALRALGDTSSTTAAMLKLIEQRLANSGLFPK